MFNLSLTVTALSRLRAAAALWQDVILNFTDLTSTFQGPGVWQLSVNLLLFYSEPRYYITTISWAFIGKEYYAVKYCGRFSHSSLPYHPVRRINGLARKKTFCANDAKVKLKGLFTNFTDIKVTLLVMGGRGNSYYRCLLCHISESNPYYVTRVSSHTHVPHVTCFFNYTSTPVYL